MTIPPPPVKDKIDIPGIGISHVWRKWFSLIPSNVGDGIQKVTSPTEDNIVTLTSDGGVQDGGASLKKFRSVTYTGNAVLTTSSLGKIIKMNNGAGNAICYLPSVDEDDIDCWVTVMRLGTGDVKILAADSDVIEKSSAGGGLVCGESGRVVANVTLYLATETKWAIMAGTGIWQTI